MEAKELFEQAAKAWQNTEELVREIVKTSAWEVLGHPNFITAWEAVSGVKCPSQVKIIATYAYFATHGYNTNRPTQAKQGQRGFEFIPNGPLIKDVAKAIGWSIIRNKAGNDTSSPVSTIHRQYVHGVPADKATTNNIQTGSHTQYTAIKAIQQHGTVPFTPPSRKHNRRTGAGPDDLVFEGFNVPRWEADAVAELSRQWDVPKAEVYRRLLTPQLEALRSVWDAANKAGVRK